jgi:flagellum-specific peptidoglycan hydrolase FlgJ
MDVCDKSNAKNKRYRDWIDQYGAAARVVAADLKIPAENLLGLSALESGWASGPFVRDGRNNFFSMHSPTPFENGVVFTKDKMVRVATFPDYETCLRAFAKSYGKYIIGKAEPNEFAKALQIAKKYGINRDGSPVKTFVPEVADTIKSFKIRMQCN